jgi:acetyl esterase/lipase
MISRRSYRSLNNISLILTPESGISRAADTAFFMRYRFIILLSGLIISTLSRADESNAAAIMPVPSAVSEQAQAYYRDWRPRPRRQLDYNNPRTMENVRRTLNKIFLANAKRISDDFELEPVDANGASAFWVRTSATRRSDKAIIYLHGGGFILGSAQSNLGTALRISARTAIPILSVDYRLAPEYPFPAGLDDALAAYRWLLDGNYGPGDIVVYGDSAGGGLTLSLALAARNVGLPQPAALVLLSPATDLTLQSDTRTTLAAYDPVLTPAGIDRLQLYAGDHDLSDPLISPVFADLSGLPPMLIQVGTREMLLSDAVRLARRARGDGVDVTLDVWDGMWHVWQDQPDLPEAEQATAEISAFMLDHLDR